MKDQQMNSIVSKRLILRRAEDLCTLRKSWHIKQAKECLEQDLEAIVGFHVDWIKFWQPKHFIGFACEDYANKYNLKFVDVYRKVTQQ